jgi:hypothetical protein
MVTTTTTLAVAVEADLILETVAAMAAMAVAEAAQLGLEQAERVVLVVTQEPLEQLALLGQTAVLVEQIQVVAQVREIPFIQEQLVTEVQEL